MTTTIASGMRTVRGQVRFMKDVYGAQFKPGFEQNVERILATLQDRENSLKKTSPAARLDLDRDFVYPRLEKLVAFLAEQAKQARRDTSLIPTQQQWMQYKQQLDTLFSYAKRINGG
jgi:hypothetical protein